MADINPYNKIELEDGYSVTDPSTYIKPQHWQIIKCYFALKEGEIPHEYYESTNLLKLLAIYKFEIHTKAFFQIALDCYGLHAAYHARSKEYQYLVAEKKELFEVLSLILDNKPSNLMIDIKLVNKKVSKSIKNQVLVAYIKKSLIELFLNSDTLFRESFETFFYLIQNNSIINPLKSAKGRKPIHGHTGMMIDILQTFLQQNTELKTENQSSISNQQAQFIYDFLCAIEVIKSDFNWQEDNIRKILDKFRSKKATTKPIELHDALKEYTDQYNLISTKIQGFSKKE